MALNELNEAENLLEEIQEILEDLSCWTVVDNQTELIAANTAGVGGILVNGSITLTAPIDITIPIYFSPCGLIVTNGNLLTISNSLSAGIFQIFDTVSGEVQFSIGSVEKIFLEWFGAQGDGATDDTADVQAAIDSVALADIPVYVLQQKNYLISNVNIPDRIKLFSEGFRNTGARFTGSAAGAMFTLANGSEYTQFSGLILDGNNLTTSLIDINEADQCKFENCNFANAERGVDLSKGGTRLCIDGCKFGSVLDFPIYISLVTNFICIRECDFSGDSINCIFADALWIGDTLIITDNTFESNPTALEDIRLLRPLATPGLHAVIERNRFDGAKVNSHIHLSEDLTVTIHNNSMSGIVVQNIFTDGQFCVIGGNYFSAGTWGVTLGANSDRNRIDHNFPNGVTTYVQDLGSRNSIFRRVDKGVTGARPVPISTEFGALYMDTTLDADGKPIWWNGVAWVDATGAIV